MGKFLTNIFWYRLLQTTSELSKIASFWLSMSILHVENHLTFFSLNDIILGEQFLLLTFVEKFDFYRTLFYPHLTTQK